MHTLITKDLNKYLLLNRMVYPFPADQNPRKLYYLHDQMLVTLTSKIAQDKIESLEPDPNFIQHWTNYYENKFSAKQNDVIEMLINKNFINPLYYTIEEMSHYMSLFKINIKNETSLAFKLMSDIKIQSSPSIIYVLADNQAYIRIPELLRLPDEVEQRFLWNQELTDFFFLRSKDIPYDEYLVFGTSFLINNKAINSMIDKRQAILSYYEIISKAINFKYTQFNSTSLQFNTIKEIKPAKITSGLHYLRIPVEKLTRPDKVLMQQLEEFIVLYETWFNLPSARIIAIVMLLVDRLAGYTTVKLTRNAIDYFFEFTSMLTIKNNTDKKKWRNMDLDVFKEPYFKIDWSKLNLKPKEFKLSRVFEIIWFLRAARRTRLKK